MPEIKIMDGLLGGDLDWIRPQGQRKQRVSIAPAFRQHADGKIEFVSVAIVPDATHHRSDLARAAPSRAAGLVQEIWRVLRSAIRSIKRRVARA